MLFRDEGKASHFLENISYYRLKGYWWDTQNDCSNHTFHANTYFEDIIDRYNFDRHLRLILFDAIERIEIALRTKMIYHLSMSYGGLWYLDTTLFSPSYVRNIIAHHSRLWSRNMVKRPTENIKNPIGLWFDNALTAVQAKKPFLIISCMIYLCNKVTPGHQIKTKIVDLFNSNPNIPIHKLGFLNNWGNEPLWK